MHFQYKITISVVICRSRKWQCQLMMTNLTINRQDSITSIRMTPYHKSNFKILIFDLDSLYLIHKTSLAPFWKQDKCLIWCSLNILRLWKRTILFQTQDTNVLCNELEISDKLKTYCVVCLQVLREVKRFNYIRSLWTKNWIQRSDQNKVFFPWDILGFGQRQDQWLGKVVIPFWWLVAIGNIVLLRGTHL